MGTYKRIPISIKKGKGSWVWDTNNKKYLDAVAGISTCTLGHSDRVLAKNLIRQLKTIQHVSNLYQIPEQEELANWLVNNSCADKVFFCNSGAEANEAAIKLARKHGHINRGINRPVILTAHASFHGRTLAAVSATGQIKYHKGFEPVVEGFKFFPYNDWDTFQELFNSLEKNGPQVAAVLIEPIQGEGGIHPGDSKFFKQLRDHCDQKKVLLIFDEVQSGMARTGRLWAYEHLDVEPDAFTLAKGLGGGHAIGALLTKEAANLFEVGEHASTFGGNPFACKAGLTVGLEIQKRNLLKHVTERGQQLEEGLKRLIKLFPNHLQEVRGLGLIQGLAIKKESSLTSQSIVQAAISKQLLLVAAGEKVVRIVPPLTIKKGETDQIIKRLENTLTTLC